MSALPTKPSPIMCSSEKPRSTLQAILVQIGLRAKYLIKSWFFLKPFLCLHNSAYPSFLRPKGIPQVDWPTLLVLRLLVVFWSVMKRCETLHGVLVTLRIAHACNWIYLKLQHRIAKIMEV